MPGVKKLQFDSGRNIGGGSSLSFNLIGSDYDQLEEVSRELQNKLKEYIFPYIDKEKIKVILK